MAKREMIQVDGNEEWGLNVSETVGIGGRNKRGDVMLIQAMFRYIVKSGRESLVGVSSIDELPQVDGNYDGRLGHLILNYQRNNRERLLNIDGVIHPASYQNREIKDKGIYPLMTMTLLHWHTFITANVALGADYTTAFLNEFPSLRAWVR